MFVEAASTEQQNSPLNIYEETRCHTNSSFVFQTAGLVIKSQENRHVRSPASALGFKLRFMPKAMTYTARSHVALCILQ